MDSGTAADREARPRSDSLIRFTLTSAFASAVGVVTAILVDGVGLAIAGLIARRSPILYHNEVVFTAAGSDLALGGGMVLTLVVGGFFLSLYPGSGRYDAARLTVLWVVLHCFRQGFTQLATMPVAEDSNVATAFATLDVPGGLELVISAAGVIGLLSVALAAAPAFLAYAPRQKLIATPIDRFSFAARIALVPGLVGPLLTVPVFLPDNGVGLIPSLPLLGLFTVATVLAAPGTRTVQIGSNRDIPGWSWLPVIWLVVLALILQLLLQRGLVIPPPLDSPFADPM